MFQAERSRQLLSLWWFGGPNHFSFSAVTKAELWTLERAVFQHIVAKSGIQKQEDKIKFLRSVPLLSNLPEEIIARLSSALKLVSGHHGLVLTR